jgi:hypothetical protein
MKHLLKEEEHDEGVEFLNYEQMEALDNSRTYLENILQGKTSKVRVGSWEEAEMIERQEDHFFCLQWEQWKTYYMNKYENINDLTGKYL